MTASLADMVRRFAGLRILVVGDVMLDEYLRGSVQRISPEAPVPVVEVSERIGLPGGAGNVATNLRALGASVVLAGLVGDDAAGAELRRLLTESGVDCRALVAVSDRPTSSKTRIVAHHQQVVRVDREWNAEATGSTAESLRDAALTVIESVDAVLFQDYDKGALSGAVLAPILRHALASGKVVTVDPKRRHFFQFRGVTLFKPNRREAEEALGQPIRTPDDEDRAGQLLLEQLQCTTVLLTLGERGMALYRSGQQPIRIEARKVREVYDVTGAGDTVISTMTLGLAAGCEAGDAARMAAMAAGLKVGKLGAVAIERSELLDALREAGL